MPTKKTDTKKPATVSGHATKSVWVVLFDQSDISKSDVTYALRTSSGVLIRHTMTWSNPTGRNGLVRNEKGFFMRDSKTEVNELQGLESMQFIPGAKLENIKGKFYLK